MKKTNVHQDENIDQFVNIDKKKVKFFQMEFLFCFLKN